MLKIINDLSVFFEDCYRRVNVREYARIIHISPPSASKLLAEYSKIGLLKCEKDRKYIFYYTNKNSKDFVDLSRIYWRHKLIEFINYANDNLVNPTIILFGSLNKAEAKRDSDIDICILANGKKLNLDIFEKKIKRNIQLFVFNSLNKITNPELKLNILNGYILSGRLRKDGLE